MHVDARTYQRAHYTHQQPKRKSTLTKTRYGSQHESEQTLNFWRWVNKYVKLGAPFPIKGFMGTPFPMRIPMLIAIGKPMFAQEGESVNDFHARYIEELQKLYAKYVGSTSDPKRKLVIV